MTFETELRRAVDTGKVIFGTRRTAKTLMNGEGKLLILSSNMPKSQKEKLQHIASLHNIAVKHAEITSKELGEICGKPFGILALLVLDPGRSKILQKPKSRKKAKK
ncbi:MAG: 50S ribosomal protein L30e [Candidatus Iainarchaeum archaeon]|uniref:Large ribosomal subunit protein eL30 n=1 Tax=Candidatus Iainarchaeum sp. TaxID=3101447 RepID=A0A497JI28_9ARCH|nr:MAG: 50S ribosomal protein L30e [Candidatus Diapherotrites archaeon]